MWIFSDIADWWDEGKRQSELFLEEFVERHPNYFGVIVAAATYTTTELAAGMVDVLRLGDGLAEGTWLGAGKDGLRLFGIIGPTGRILQVARSTSATRLARVIFDPIPRGPICSWVATTKALVQTGQKIGGRLFVAVDDLAAAVGLQMNSIKGIALADMANNLKMIGAKIGVVTEIKSVSELTQMMRRDGSVVLFSVKVVLSTGREDGHAMYAFYDHFGRFRIMDRTGVYNDLKTVAEKYNAEFIPRAAVMIHNAYVKLLPSGMSVLAIPVLGVAASEKK